MDEKSAHMMACYETVDRAMTIAMVPLFDTGSPWVKLAKPLQNQNGLNVVTEKLFWSRDIRYSLFIARLKSSKERVVNI